MVKVKENKAIKKQKSQVMVSVMLTIELGDIDGD